MRCAMFCRCLITIFLVLSATNENSFAISRKAALGKELFFDTNLSTPPGQACARCHDPKVFFTDPDNKEPTSDGSSPLNFA